jgi:hypothetical protein
MTTLLFAGMMVGGAANPIGTRIPGGCAVVCEREGADVAATGTVLEFDGSISARGGADGAIGDGAVLTLTAAGAWVRSLPALL